MSEPVVELHDVSLGYGGAPVLAHVSFAIARGEFVGILGDRIWESERGRSVRVPFLGRRTSFPLGPFLLQAALGCPMLLSTCVRTGHGRYAALTEVLAPAAVVPRCERMKYAEELAQRYAATLERECLRTPYQWFNFFDFWRESVDL